MWNWFLRPFGPAFWICAIGMALGAGMALAGWLAQNAP